jgi:hypothetical protein
MLTNSRRRATSGLYASGESILIEFASRPRMAGCEANRRFGASSMALPKAG